MKIRFLRRAGALLLALTLAAALLAVPAAAVDPGDQPDPPATVAVTGVSLNPASLSLEVGDTGTLTAAVAPADATNQAVTWSSSNEAVATVSNGTVSAISAGQAAITVTTEDGGFTAQCFVTVTVPPPVAVSSVSLNKDSLSLEVGQEEQLLATVLPANAADKTVTWYSSNTRVATVGEDGTVQALSAGTALISAGAGGKFAYCNLTVTAPPTGVTAVELDQRAVSIPVGGSLTLTATVIPSSAADKFLTWKSSNSAVKVVPSSTGGTAVVSVPSTTAVGTTATITVTSSNNPGAADSCLIRVVAAQPPAVTSVAITSRTSDEFKYVDPGKTFQLTAEAYPTNALEADRKITWSSSDTSVATVGQDGVVKGVSPGKAVITAQAGGSDGPTAVREIEVSGLLLSYVKKSSTGGVGTTVQLTPDTVVELFQYRDISVTVSAYGQARLRTINWDSTNNTVAQVIGGRVTANYPGENAIITAAAAGTGYSASFKVRVTEDVADAITVNMGSSPSYSFSSVVSELNSRSQAKAGGPLDNVYNLKVSTKNGVLYYRFNSPDAPNHGVGGTERYYYQPTAQGQMALRDITFVPNSGFSGTAVVDYNAVSTNGTAFTGTIRIEATATGDVTYSTAMDQPVTFAAEHFSAICRGRNGQAIRHVTFEQPSSSRGTLYYNYSPTGQYSPKVDSATRYYATSNPSIDQVTFVPAKGYIGDVDIAYRCTDSSGASYTGTVTVTVYSPDGSESRDVEYSTGLNQRLELNGADFNTACQRATNGTLDRIRFDSLPSSSAGILYLNYTSSSSTRVSTGRNYYRNSTPRISNITFVPARNYSGTVTIPFTGTNTSGATFSGNLVIHVDDSLGTVHYSTPRNQTVTFSAEDFNDACRQANGRTLNRVRFTRLPSSSAGTLYYNYVSSSSTGTRVSTGTDYYRSGSPSLSSVTFSPASGYDGTVSIPFDGYDSNGSRFDGTVTIAVGSASSSRTVSYSTVTGGSVRFDAADFNTACRSATGDTLNYVRFDLPASRYGTLYYQYSTSTRTGTAVSSGTGYYRSGGSRQIGDVSFAASSTAGTVTFGYTGYSTRGDSFSGTVEIQVSSSATGASSTIRYTGSSAPISFRALDFQNACQTALGNALSYVQFSTLPAVGHLYQNYSGPGHTGTGASSVTRYGVQELGQLSYVPRAEYQGTIVIPYTAYDVQGGSYAGTVEIQLSNSYCYTPFTDVAAGWDWAKPSIEFLRSSGITTGYSDNTFRPGQQISRGEFTLMICRAFQFPTTGSSGFPDVPAGSVYAGAVASARDLGIVQGNNGRFQPDRPITRQSAMTMICRAMEAAGQPVSTADSSLLAAYADGGQVSAHARSSVAALIQMGAVRGTANMRINPTAAISRAEMAVILHRVLSR